MVADKATEPFYRICGDYAVFVNNWVVTGHYPLPDVRSALNKISGFKYFIDSNCCCTLASTMEEEEDIWKDYLYYELLLVLNILFFGIGII